MGEWHTWQCDRCELEIREHFAVGSWGGGVPFGIPTGWETVPSGCWEEYDGGRVMILNLVCATCLTPSDEAEIEQLRAHVREQFGERPALRVVPDLEGAPKP